MPLDLRKVLSVPWAYRAFRRVFGSRSDVLVTEFIRPRPGDRIVDLGCGTGDILERLPAVDYTGIDISESYIAAARTRFGSRGKFLCGRVSPEMLEQIGPSDIALAIGLLHHLSDPEALQLLELARQALKPTGRLVTFDGCYHEGQSALVRYLLDKDRGQFVRTQNQYVSIASRVFSAVSPHLRQDLLRLPYSHLIMVCS